MIKNIKQFLFIAGLLMIAAGAQPVGAAFWQWSTTPANNATADPSINWQEGMSPSSVNDSARAMMSVLAAYRIDNGGTLTTGGSSTAYTLTTSTPFGTAASMDGQTISFTVNASNGANPTLNVNGIGAFPIITASGTPIAANSMVNGNVYTVTFVNSLSSFKLREFFNNPYTIPLGGILWSTSPTAPNNNFLAPSGQCISTTTYAAYWVQQGSPASGSCPGGQFAIIDMRGRVAAALDNLNGVAASRLTSQSTGCGIAFTSVGVSCPNGLEHDFITLAQLPQGITSSVSVSVSGSTSTNLTWRAGSNGTWVDREIAQGGSAVAQLGTVGMPGTFSGSGSGSATSNSTGATRRPFVQPTIGLIPYLRVL